MNRFCFSFANSRVTDKSLRLLHNNLRRKYSLFSSDDVYDAVMQAIYEFLSIPVADREFSPDHVYAWLYLVAKRRLLNCLRNYYKPTSASNSSYAEPARYASVLEIQDMLNYVKPEQRKVLELHIEGYTFREIADMSGEKIETVKKRYQRALAAARGLVV